MRILIVEDQPDIASLMMKMIACSGHEARLAEGGAAAISMAAEATPHLVLLDIHLPGIDGYEVAQRIRDRYGDRFPIFAVTASPIDVALAQRSGFDGVFAKPFDMRKLNILLEQLTADSN